MPSGIGGSYRSLADDVVYKSTTVAEAKNSMMESVKKAFNFAGNSRKMDPYILSEEERTDKKPIVVSRYEEWFFFPGYVIYVLGLGNSYLFTQITW